MTVWAYLRVSTDKQDVDNQRHGILEYANDKTLGSLEFREDTVSGKKKWKERAVGKMLDEAEKGDTVVFAEVSRMARSTLQVLEILEYCTEKGISVHIAKQRMIFDGSMQAKITATVLGMAAEIEREFISMRTKEALKVRKEKGLPVGRPEGAKNKRNRLDDKKPQIQDLMNKGLSVLAIAKVIECPATTLYDYVKRNKIKAQKELNV